MDIQGHWPLAVTRGQIQNGATSENEHHGL